jgi:hypothetical protein
MGFVFREQIFSERWRLRVERNRYVSWVLLPNGLQEHGHETTGTSRVLSRRCDQVIAHSEPCSENDRMTIDQKKQLVVRFSFGSGHMKARNGAR